MNKTKIEWVKNPDGTQGSTCNPVKGECPVGCSYCYVKPLRTRWGWHKDIRFYPEELEAIRRRRKPTGIFLGSTIELFHFKTIHYMPKIMATIRACPQHRFYLLTKQPQNLSNFSPFPDNCWVGVTATEDIAFLRAIRYLHEVQAKVKYISFEPLLSAMFKPATEGLLLHGGIKWVIIGAQTKPTLYPNPLWVHEIIVACREAGIPYFLKNNLAGCLTKEPPYYYLKGLPAKGQLRQEMPE